MPPQKQLLNSSAWLAKHWQDCYRQTGKATGAHSQQGKPSCTLIHGGEATGLSLQHGKAIWSTSAAMQTEVEARLQFDGIRPDVCGQLPRS